MPLKLLKLLKLPKKEEVADGWLAASFGWTPSADWPLTSRQRALPSDEQCDCRWDEVGRGVSCQLSQAGFLGGEGGLMVAHVVAFGGGGGRREVHTQRVFPGGEDRPLRPLQFKEGGEAGGVLLFNLGEEWLGGGAKRLM